MVHFQWESLQGQVEMRHADQHADDVGRALCAHQILPVVGGAAYFRAGTDTADMAYSHGSAELLPTWPFAGGADCFPCTRCNTR